MNNPIACIHRGDVGECGETLALADSLVVPEYEHPVLQNWPTRGRPELVPRERWLRSISEVVKEVCRIQCTVPHEFIRIAMELICSRLGRGCDDSSRGPSVLRAIVGRYNGKL